MEHHSCWTKVKVFKYHLTKSSQTGFFKASMTLLLMFFWPVSTLEDHLLTETIHKHQQGIWKKLRIYLHVDWFQGKL